MDSTSDLVLMFATIFMSLFLLSPSPIEAVAAPIPPPTLAPNHAPTLAPTPPPALVQSLCDKVKNHAFCMKALQSDPRTATASNYLSLAKIVLDIGATSTSSSRKYIDHMLQSNDTKPAIKPALQCCVDYYGDVVASFTGAYKELDVDYMSANYDVFVAMDYIGVCEKYLKNYEVNDASIFARNKIAREYILIGYTVTNALPH